MDQMQNFKSSLVMLLLVSIMPDRFVICHMCTRGADHLYCHEIIAASDSDAAVQPEYEKVYTVPECRDICNSRGCIAFEYQAKATERQQTCKLFWSNPDDIDIEENFSRCNKEEWLYSWKRPEENMENCRIIEDEVETNELQVSEANKTNTTTATTTNTTDSDEKQNGGSNQTQVSKGSSGTTSRRRRRRRRSWRRRRYYVWRRRRIYRRRR